MSTIIVVWCCTYDIRFAQGSYGHIALSAPPPHQRWSTLWSAAKNDEFVDKINNTASITSVVHAASCVWEYQVCLHFANMINLNNSYTLWDVAVDLLFFQSVLRKVKKKKEKKKLFSSRNRWWICDLQFSLCLWLRVEKKGQCWKIHSAWLTSVNV